METARVQVRASGNLQLPLLVGLVEADEGPGTLGSLPGLLHAAALVAWSDGSSGSGSRSNSTSGPDDRAPTKGLSKKEVMQQLARKIKEEGGRNGNSQEGQLDEMLLFCITQFLGELALIVSDHTLYRPHKLIGLNKELAKMAKILQGVSTEDDALWILRRAKSTISELPRHISKDKEGSAPSGLKGKSSVDSSDMRPASLEQRMSDYIDQICTRLIDMQKELASGQAGLNQKTHYSQVIFKLSSRFEALDKQGYLGQAEPKEDAQQADTEEQLPSLPNFIQSLPGEKVSYVASSVRSKVWNGGAAAACVGTLFVTTYQVIFVTEDLQTKSFPIHFIASMEKVGGRKRTMGNDDYGLDIFLKDTRIIRFVFERDSPVYPPPRRMTHTKILKGLIRPASRLFAFEYHASLQRVAPPPVDGWTIYNAEKEYRRMGVPSKKWKISMINKNYSWCPSYPSRLVVPARFPDELLPAVIKFRSRNRIPVLTWIDPKSGAAIVRCSQPLTGMQRGRCSEDEQLLASIIRTVPKAGQLHIFDARPKANAVANTAKGAGYEVLANYQNCSLSFLGINNIHVIRDSQKKVRDMCHQFVNPMNDDSKWLNALDASQWLSHISLISSSSADVAKFVHLHGEPVVVHCSDGWDRTSQIVALAQIMLDPYYRTIEGFIVLIEKDWLSFGHQFALRSGHDGYFYADGQRAPIFMQWVECVWQMLRQSPLAFEYNERFLLELLHHSHSCRFGTFLYNTEKERIQEKLSQSTESLWTYLLAEKDNLRIVNPFYKPVNRVIIPNCSLRRMQFWEGYFLQWAQEGLRDSDASNLDQHVLNLVAEKDRQIAQLQAQLREYQAMLNITPTAASNNSKTTTNIGDAMTSKLRGRGLAKMKLISERSAKKPKSKRIVTTTAATASSAAGDAAAESQLHPRATAPPEHRNDHRANKKTKANGGKSVTAAAADVAQRSTVPSSASTYTSDSSPAAAANGSSHGDAPKPAAAHGATAPPPAAPDAMATIGDPGEGKEDEPRRPATQGEGLGSNVSDVKWRVGVKN